jgi:hypothetical protein
MARIALNAALGAKTMRSELNNLVADKYGELFIGRRRSIL